MNNSVELAQTLLKSHGLQVHAVIRRRTVTGVVTENGQRYIWKPGRVRDDEARLQALSSLADTYTPFGQPAAALPIRTLAGSFLVQASATEFGHLQPWLVGRHVDVRVPAERMRVLTSLARVQRASQRAGYPGYDVLQRGTLLTKFRVKERAMQRIWETAERAYPALGTWRNDVFAQMAQVIQAYSQFVARHRSSWMEYTAFCHRDLAPHNVLFQPDGGIGWIDFDHAGYDDMCSDVLQFWSHTLFLARLTPEESREMLSFYADAAQLTTNRRALLFTLARWPDILIRSIIEWVRGGCREDGMTKIHYALLCERKRLVSFPDTQAL